MKHRRRKLSDRVQTVIDEVLHALRQETIDSSSATRARMVQLRRLEERILMSASPVMIVAEAAGVTTEAGAHESQALEFAATNTSVSTSDPDDAAMSESLSETVTTDELTFEASEWGEDTSGLDEQLDRIDALMNEAINPDDSGTTQIDDLLAQQIMDATPESGHDLPADAIGSEIAAGLEDEALVDDLLTSIAQHSALIPENAMDVIQNVLGDHPTAERSSLLSGPELIVIDYRVRDADTLLTELLSENRDVRLLRLTADDDGLAQITTKLQSLGTVSVIHLLTHGRDGEILLGSTRLSASSLPTHTAELSAWSNYLTADADLLVYGCDVAASSTGQNFVERLHQITAADVAASTDTTGGSSLGGDWDLEYVTGNVAAGPLFSTRVIQSWQHELPAGQTITVTTTADVVDATNLSSVTALLANSGADGRISLREAIIAANQDADVDEIVLGSGVYSMTIVGRNENAAARGDFDIQQDVIIRGAGAELTRIDARSIDGVFHVRGPSSLTMSDVTVTGGLVNTGGQRGGGFLVDAPSTLVLNRVVITGNAVTKDGGGIASSGIVSLIDVTISGNTADRDGGGLWNSGKATIEETTLSANTAISGGAISHSGTDLTLINSTISGNTATSSGGGLSLSGATTIKNATIAMNTASIDGAGLYVTSGTSTVQNTLFASNLLTNSTKSNISGTITSLGNNLSSDFTGALIFPQDLVGVDPGIEALAKNGGFSQTHALKPFSAAIDAGSTAGAPATDQRDIVRDGNVDIGAYEYDRAFLATSETQVNTTTTNIQETSAAARGSQQAIARDAFGNTVIVWSTQNQDGSGYGVFARLFDSFGQPRSSEFRVNEATLGDQFWARVAMDAAGGFVVTWTSDAQDGDGRGIYARRFAANGTALGAEFLVNTTTTADQLNSTIAINKSGDFVIAWEGNGPGDPSGVFFRRFTSSGTASDATELRANIAVGIAQRDAQVALDDTGRFVVAWEESQKIYFQRFSASAVVEGTRVQVSPTADACSQPAMAMDGAGNFTIVYRTDGAIPGISGRGFNADGTQRYTWFQVSSGDSASASITMSPTGQFLVTYQKTGDGNGTGIFARKYENNGQPNSVEFQINQTITGNQSRASSVMLDQDNFAVVWTGEGVTDTDGVFVRQFGTATANALTAHADFATTPTNTPVAIPVLDNDSRPLSSNAIVLDVTAPANGSATLDTNGQVHYSPNSGFAGSDTLTYLLTDGQDGTTHYWGLSGNAVDSVGTMDGTIYNNPAVIEGSRGSALKFNEVNQYVQLSDITYNNEFTLSFDFKVDDNTGTAYQYLYSHGTETAVNGLNILLIESGHGTNANVMRTTFGDTTDVFNRDALNFNAATLIGDGQWHTYTLTVSAANGTRVYVDGVLMASDTTRGGNTFNPTGSAVLGARNDLSTVHFFGGGLDSVRLFDRSLTPAEVGQLDAGLSTSANSTQTTGLVYITVQNAPPVATANGPYTTYVGLPVTLTASGSSDLNGDSLQYEWDLNYNGADFTPDLTGQTLSVTAAQLQAAGLGLGTHTVAVRVMDTRGAESISASTLSILSNAPPTDINLSNVVVPGQVSGATIGQVSGVDSTPGDSLTYDVNDTRFEIVGGVLILKSGASIDRSVEPSVAVKITATDLAGNAFSKDFTLTVSNGPVVARDKTLVLTEDAPRTVTGNGVLDNDDRVTTTVTTGAVLEFDASKDTDGDKRWTDSTAVTGFDYQIGTGVTQNLNPFTNHPGILSSWALDGTNLGALIIPNSLSLAPGNLTDGDVTIEFWFRPLTVGPKYMLFDSGSAQPGTGTSVRLNGTQLEFALYTNGVGASVVSDISSELTGGDFIQFVGTIRLAGGTATLQMFVNGVYVGTDLDFPFSTWSDSNEGTALGGLDGTANVAGMPGGVAFSGDLAIARFYGRELTSAEVRNNFLAVAGVSSGLTVSATNTASTIGAVTVSQSGSYTYNPNGQFDSLAANETATDSFTYTARDTFGNTDSATVQITILGINDAPVVNDLARPLGTIVANQTSAAISVGSLTTGVSDADNNALKGIAIAAVSGAGTWQYSTDGLNWSVVAPVSSTQTLLLDETCFLRFVGTDIVAGNASISYRMWDQTGATSGGCGTKFNTTTTGVGGAAPFSSDTVTGTLTLDAANLSPTGTADNYQTPEDTPLVTTSASGWFDSAWDTRSKIMLNNSSGPALINQVVLVTLTPANIDYSSTQNAGQDLRFVDIDGSLLSFEIEEWNVAGTSRVWVRVPQIDGNSVTDHIWMYYGNSAAADVQNSAAVWAEQNLVLHMDGNVTDSSPAATGAVAASTTAAGISSGAQQFDGNSSSSQMNNSVQLDDLFAGGGTISAWINPTGWGQNDYGRIADKASSTFSLGMLGTGWAFQMTPDGSLLFEHGFTIQQGEWETSAGAISLNQWQHVALTFDSSNPTLPPRIYVNGVAANVVTNLIPVGVADSDSGQKLTIGNHAISPSRTFSGRIDEFRGTATILSASQISADYE
ncbi:MAG: DUF2341 domain-containing protein, partial [Planctomycetota bacterium]